MLQMWGAMTGSCHQMPPPRAKIAFDQLADAEKAAVLASLQLLKRDGLHSLSTAQATRLEGLEPLYVLRPAPDVRVLVRAGAGARSRCWTSSVRRRCATSRMPSSAPTGRVSSWTFDRAACLANLDAFATLLGVKQRLSERDDILPFFRSHPHLACSASFV